MRRRKKWKRRRKAEVEVEAEAEAEAEAEGCVPMDAAVACRSPWMQRSGDGEESEEGEGVVGETVRDRKSVV